MNNSFDINVILAGGENQNVEFKEKLPPPHRVARIISAFANTEGGAILFGVSDSGQVVGIQPEHFGRFYTDVLEKITGDVKVSKRIISLDKKSIGVIQVDKSTDLVSAADGYFMRDGAASRQLTALEISSKAVRAADSNHSIDLLSQTVAKQTEEIGKLRKSFEKANSWQRKALYALLGAIASGLVKTVLVALGIELG